MPKVSVVVPTYNRTKLLMTRSLPSILRQKTELDVEVLVVGDGTEKATEYAIWSMGEDRIRFVNLPRPTYPEDDTMRWNLIGLAARNHGFDWADGEFLAELDDDDAFAPGHLQTLYEALTEGTFDLAYGRSIAFNELDQRVAEYGFWPPKHFAYCEGAWLAKHDLGYRYDPECVKRGLPGDGDKIDRMVAGGVQFTFVDKVVHFYWPNRHPLTTRRD